MSAIAEQESDDERPRSCRVLIVRFGCFVAVSRHFDAVFFLLNIGETTEYPEIENPETK